MEKDVQVGQVVAGKYRIEQTLGRGGMGVVMAALHEQLNQRVALKFLTDNAYQQPEAVARFVREARAAVQIQSEHVARVMDVGTLENGAPYMVMEYLRGRDLKDVSTRRGPMPVGEAVDYVLQACDAVAEAHSLGIVHRDLKPSNLFLTERPDGSPLVKVLDFGISKALHAGDRNSQLQMTATSAIMGSPQYMSPEQIRSSKNVDARADVWALGTILHELLTGAPAYVADTVPGLLAMIVADAPPPLSASRPDAPKDLEAIILRCLQKDREQRFSNVAALARALERFASSEIRPLVRRIARVLGESTSPQLEQSVPPPPSYAVSEPAVQTNGTWSRTGRRLEAPPRPVWYARPEFQVAAGVLVLGIGVSLWLYAAGSGAGADGDLQVSTSGTAAHNTPAPHAAAAPPGPVIAPIPAQPVAVVPQPVAPQPVAPLTATPRIAPETVANSTANSIRPVIEAAPDRPVDEDPRPTTKPPRSSATREREAQRPDAARLATIRRAAGAKPKPIDTDPGAAPATTSKKKGDTLDDLFNDTK